MLHILYLVTEIVDESCLSDVNGHSNQDISIYGVNRLHAECIDHGYVINTCQRFTVYDFTHWF